MKHTVVTAGTEQYVLPDTTLVRITIFSESNTYINDNGSDGIFKIREYFGQVTLDKDVFVY